jgi:hypothetical protein
MKTCLCGHDESEHDKFGCWVASCNCNKFKSMRVVRV